MARYTIRCALGRADWAVGEEKNVQTECETFIGVVVALQQLARNGWIIRRYRLIQHGEYLPQLGERAFALYCDTLRLYFLKTKG